MIKEDFAKEIANIGSGYAAKALSDFSDKKIFHIKPKILVLKSKADYLKLFKINSDIVASIVKFSSDIKGEASLILPTSQAFDMVNLISKKQNVPMKDNLKDYFKTFNEIANIVIGAYFTAISEILDLKVKLEIPHSIFGPTTKVMRVINNITGKNLGEGICIHTKFSIEGENIQGYFALFINPAEINKLAKKMHVKE